MLFMKSSWTCHISFPSDHQSRLRLTLAAPIAAASWSVGSSCLVTAAAVTGRQQPMTAWAAIWPSVGHRSRRTTKRTWWTCSRSKRSSARPCCSTWRCSAKTHSAENSTAGSVCWSNRSCASGAGRIWWNRRVISATRPRYRPRETRGQRQGQRSPPWARRAGVEHCRQGRLQGQSSTIWWKVFRNRIVRM